MASPSDSSDPRQGTKDQRRFSERYLWLIVPLIFLAFWFVERGKMTRGEFLEACRTEVLAGLNHPRAATFEWDESVRIAPTQMGQILRSTVAVPDQSGTMIHVKF